uniref:Uncharacterized protein n=1 Tax=Candidatus Kentrum sp. LFY TaxID=2126342 RepID=A0A450WJ02_9GAMM|nr:MAG: hypothetical protein BECKLFY1418C_GA0070996_102815 [Candidatus Kentron sp. LFY]
MSTLHRMLRWLGADGYRWRPRVPRYTPCPHSTGGGCDDYDNRPGDTCGNFDCAWIIEGSLLPDWMKPNNAKVIVILDKLNWNGLAVDLAVPVGRRIPPRSLDWLIGYSRENMRPLIYTEQVMASGKFQRQQQIFGYGPPAFQQDLLRWRQEGKRLW